MLLPDVLLSGTRVASSFKCARQAVLEECFGGSSSAKAVEGTLLHELFQAALLDENPSAAGLDGHARCIAGRHTDRLLEVGLDEAQARAYYAAYPTLRKPWLALAGPCETERQGPSGSVSAHGGTA